MPAEPQASRALATVERPPDAASPEQKAWAQATEPAQTSTMSESPDTMSRRRHQREHELDAYPNLAGGIAHVEQATCRPFVIGHSSTRVACPERSRRARSE